MTTRVQTAPPFDVKIKRLRKKYPSVRADLNWLIEQLRNDERPGDKIPQVGYDVYKARLGNPSAGRGKSGGATSARRRFGASLKNSRHNDG
jgi:mRNA-degrading endonuclease RelE of RelBE toxin-antitoxin system